MSGRQSPSLPGEAGSISASSSSAEAPPDNIATALANILSEVGGLRRSIQRLDGRMDTVVDRVNKVENWIPNVEGDTSSERQLDAGSIADSDPNPLLPAVDSGGPESTHAGSERAVSEHAALPSRPPRPDKAAGRSGTPHELKPPQVQAFRALTSKDKAAIQRLSALLGRPVRDCLDGDTSLVDLLSDPVPGSNEQLQPQSPSTPTSPTQPLQPTTPPDSPTHPRTLICRQEFIGTFEGQSMEVENFVSQIRDVWRSNRQPEWERAVVRALPMALKGDAAAWHQGLDDTEADALTSVDKWIAALREAFPVNVMRLRSTRRGSQPGLASLSRVGQRILPPQTASS
ncbi:hypothetical protein CF335_g9415, partial [Tilletia laevis]